MKESKEDNLEQILETKDKAYVLFYASWCPFSRRFLPIFEEYAKQHPQDCISIMIDFKPDLCNRYEVNYYPTVLLFKKGKVKTRLEATPGAGLTKKQFTELTTDS
jgi:thiol-disulfide isomerase/thioredoxin